MDPHGDRPEVRAALEGRLGASTRFSDTLRRQMMYVAVPVWRDGRVACVARVSLPLTTVEWTLRTVHRQVAMAAGAAAVLFAVLSYALARRLARPLEDMRQVAERLAGGDLSARAAAPDEESIAALASALNRMAAQLQERIEALARQRNEQEAVLSSMVEGVLAVDRDQRILHANQAAVRALDLPPGRAVGRGVHEAIRNADFLQFLAATLASDAATEAQVVFRSEQDRWLQLRGAPLTDSSGARIGALVVLTDVTRLRRLETIRQDFVANVSHELKTPITAIKGCAETLTDDLESLPAAAHPFVRMLTRHVGRLEAIVEDLLRLSQIEHDAERGEIERVPGPIRDVLKRAIQDAQPDAMAKRIAVDLDCAEDLRAPIHAALLEQAVVNLLDNAIKYSAEGTAVGVSAAARGERVEIQVSDQGVGIESRHLPRIFERFYRVDTARSRAMGGTGLGLAIVKHIALAHRGGVAVESEPGRGSVFTIWLPREAAAAVLAPRVPAE
jgi:two-component system phosphate regulon sensor histidine kinase PhoR